MNFEQGMNPVIGPAQLAGADVGMGGNTQYLPDSLSYPETPDIAFAHKYNQIIVTPVGNQTQGYLSGEKCVINFKSNDFVDGHETYIMMTVQSWPLENGYLANDAEPVGYYDKMHFNPGIANKVVQMDGNGYGFIDQQTINNDGQKIEEISHFDVKGVEAGHALNTWLDRFCKSFEGLGGIFGNSLNTGSSMTYASNMSKNNVVSIIHQILNLTLNSAMDAKAADRDADFLYNVQEPYGWLMGYQEGTRWVDGNIAYAPINDWPDHPKIEYLNTNNIRWIPRNSFQGYWINNTTTAIPNWTTSIKDMTFTQDKINIEALYTLTNLAAPGNYGAAALYYCQLGSLVPVHLKTLEDIGNGIFKRIADLSNPIYEPKDSLVMSGSRGYYPMLDEESVLLQRGDSNKNKMGFWNPLRDQSYNVATGPLYYHRNIHGFSGMDGVTQRMGGENVATPSNQRLQMGNHTNKLSNRYWYSDKIGYLDPSVLFPDWAFQGPCLTNYTTLNLANISSWGAPQLLRSNYSKPSLAHPQTVADPTKNFANRSKHTPDDKTAHNAMGYYIDQGGNKIKADWFDTANAGEIPFQEFPGLAYTDVNSSLVWADPDEPDNPTDTVIAAPIGPLKKINPGTTRNPSTIDFQNANVQRVGKGNDNDTMFYGLEKPFPEAFCSSCFEPFWSQTVNQRYMRDGLPCYGPVTEHTFFLPFFSGLGALMPAEDFKLIPWRAFRNCEIVFDFADSALFSSWHTTDKAVRRFIVKDFKMVFSVAKFYDDAIYKALDEQLAQGVILKTVSWYCCAYQILPGGVIPSEISINVGFDSLKALTWCFYSRDYLSSMACRKHQAFSPCIESFQIQNGSDLYPLDPIKGNSGSSVGARSNFNFLYQLKKIYGKHSTVDLGHINSSSFAVNFRQFNYQDAADQLLKYPIRASSSATDLSSTFKYFKWQGWNYDHPAFQLSFYYENSCKALAYFGYDLDRSNYEVGVISGINTTQNRPFKLRFTQARSVTLPYGRDGEIYVFGLYDLQLQMSVVNVIPKGLSG